MFLTQNKFHSTSFSPFRSSHKRSSQHEIDLIFQTFEETLTRRLKTLAVSSPSISLNWLSLAVDLLLSTHADADAIMSSASGESRSIYLDHSVKLLDVCNLMLREIGKLRHHRLLMCFVLQLLQFSGDGDVPSPENLRRASECIVDWERYWRSFDRRRGFDVRELDVLVRDVFTAIACFSPPRGKISTVEKVVHRMIYAVGMITVFVAGVSLSALSGFLVTTKVRVPSEFLWADSVNDIQTAIFDSERRVVLSEIDNMAGSAFVLRELIDGGVTAVGDKERLKIAADELRTVTENVSVSLDRLEDAVNEIFGVVSSRRNSVLNKYRAGPTAKQRK